MLVIALAIIIAAPRANAQCTGDLTGSGSVGVGDLLELLACWGPVSGPCVGADLTGNGSVGVSDLLELLANWGPCPCTPDCAGVSCGPDGCGGSCGSCSEGYSCLDGECVCEPDCEGLECGAGDGCGGTCGPDPCPNPNSCAGWCGEQAPGGCWCTEACCLFEDCCIDKHNVCGGCSPGGTGPDSCIGYCGGNPGHCWCDEDCCVYNDCCENKQFVCGGCSP